MEWPKDTKSESKGDRLRLGQGERLASAVVSAPCKFTGVFSYPKTPTDPLRTQWALSKYL